MNKGKIFILWFQGEKNAPQLVKACINSVRKNSNGHEVIVLDNNNLFDWIPTFSKKINQKFKTKKFPIQLESDLIRLCLLSQYHCLWLDATVFVSQKIPNCVFETDFYTVIREEANKSDISGKISSSIMGSNGSPRSQNVFSFCRDMLWKYIETEDDLINYLLIENIFNIAISNNKWLEELIDKYYSQKKDVLQLVKILNDEYTPDKVKTILNKNLFNKLNFHGKYLLLTPSGKATIYKKLVEGQL